MYQTILDYMYNYLRLSTNLRLSTHCEKEECLKGLQPFAVELWQSYMNASVHANYASFGTQMVYMLRYFPPYSQLLPVILEQLDGLPFSEPHIHAAFFGAGPAPELYGLIQYFRRRRQNVHNVTAHLYDIAIDKWTNARNLNVQELIPQLWPKCLIYPKYEVNVNCCQMDIGKRDVIQTTQFSTISQCQIVVFQNCLNELDSRLHINALENISTILHQMTSGSLLIIIDPYKYCISTDFINDLAAKIQTEKLGNILLRTAMDFPEEYDTRDIQSQMPPIITESLFIGRDSSIPEHSGLILKQGILKFQNLVVQKI